MIRFGVVGCGLHAVKRLLPGFSMAEKSTVIALSRRDLARARKTADQHGVDLAFDSAAELCCSAQVDAVFVSTPDAFHRQDVDQAIRCGKPVLCEKPMAMNADEARQMVACARRQGVILGVAQVIRFEESTRRFRKRISAGDIGRPLLARAEFFYPALESRRSWIHDPKLACGGPIADVGVHCVDALRFVLGDEVNKVYTQAVSDEVSGELESAAVLTLEFEGGTPAVVAVSARASYRTFLEVIGEEGTLLAHDAFNLERPVTIELKRGPSATVCRQSEEVSNRNAFASMVDGFAAAIEEGRDFEIPGEEGLQNQIILDAAYRSRETGRSERVRRT